jgi:hypothetical protein
LVLNFRLALLIFVFLIGHRAQAQTRIDPKRYTGEPQWDSFSRFVEEENARDRKDGTAYLVSGALALVGSTIGYQQTTDPFAHTVFTVAQSMGIAAMGYGTYLLEIGNENRSFYNAVNSSTSLESHHKNELLSNYLREKNEIHRKTRLIRAFTHGFIAAINFYNGSRQTDSNLKSVHYFIGGINLVAVVSFSF